MKLTRVVWMSALALFTSWQMAIAQSTPAAGATAAKPKMQKDTKQTASTTEGPKTKKQKKDKNIDAAANANTGNPASDGNKPKKNKKPKNEAATQAAGNSTAGNKTKSEEKSSKMNAGNSKISKPANRAEKPSAGNDKVIGKDAQGRTLYEGPRGGQYYINGNGNKTYVKPDKQ